MSSTDEMDEIVKEFLIEGFENLDSLDQELLALEQNPSERSLLGGIFRRVHTIKGTCGFLGFHRLERVAHTAENLLSLLRDGVMSADERTISALLSSLDAIRTMMDHIAALGADGEDDYDELVALLTEIKEGADGVPAEAPEPKSAAPSPEPAPAPAPAPMQTAPPPVEEEPIFSDAPQGTQRAEPKRNRNDNPLFDASIRVDVSLLDRLMNLVGELVLARNQLLQYRSTQTDPAFLNTAQQLDLITTELQEGVMKTRMQPIDNVWSKFPRVVRDLALSCGKRVRMEMEGRETELDKTLLEAIKDPLTHIVRNSVDHGIEAPEARSARGKPAEGVLSLRAYHEGGQVNIEIADDGGGIDPERVAGKAVQRGLISREQARRLSKRELTNLIFHPGFSTAEKVTNVSGRGVGMDVVRTNIEKIGGAVDVHSTPGEGTTIKVKIPLTLAIIPALIVTCGGNHFALPQVSLIELVRLEGQQARTGIEWIHGVPVHRLRGRLLPLVHLHEQLGLKPAPRVGQEELINIVVLHADDRTFGLVVDEINDTEEIVVKPLSKQIHGIHAFAGATIRGDGRVALILDAMGLAQKAGVIAEIRESSGSGTSRSESSDTERRSLLLFTVGHARMAMPLELVARLEEFNRETVEQAGRYDVVQYRGALLPLVYLGDQLGQVTSADDDAPLQVLVYRQAAGSVGLVVDRIVDIVEEELVIYASSHGAVAPGVSGSAVVHGKVTDLLDVPGILMSSGVPVFGPSSNVLPVEAHP